MTPTSIERERLSHALLLGIMCVWFIALFHFLGNMTDVPRFSRSVLQWMVMRWGDATIYAGDYSHGWLIPIVSLFALWRRRHDLKRAPREVVWRALGLVLFGLLLHWVGVRAQQPRVSLAAMILLLWAIPLFLWGKSVARLLIFPAAYLLLCIPLNFFDSFAFQLRILATVVSSALLNGMGVGVIRSGSAIYAADGSGFALDVADPCSGIHYLLAMTALTAAYAHFTQKSLWKQWLLFLCAIPLAVLGNVMRVTVIGIAAHTFGQDIAYRISHQWSGYIVFVVAIACMIGIGALLNRIRPTAPSQTAAPHPPAGSTPA